MLVDNLHDGHRAHEEEECGACLAEIAFDGLTEFKMRKIESVVSEGEEGPADDAHEYGYRRLVDFRDSLEGYEQIAYAECCHNDSDC